MSYPQICTRWSSQSSVEERIERRSGQQTNGLHIRLAAVPQLDRGRRDASFSVDIISE